MTSKTLVITTLLLSLMALSPLQLAHAHGDNIEARRLLASGEILPLESILKIIRPKYPGKIIEIELEEEKGHIVYEIEFLGEDGVITQVFIDAKTGKLLPFIEDD